MSVIHVNSIVSGRNYEVLAFIITQLLTSRLRPDLYLCYFINKQINCFNYRLSLNDKVSQAGSASCCSTSPMVNSLKSAHGSVPLKHSVAVLYIAHLCYK